MHWWKKIKHASLWIKITNWEYWPMYITNIPVVFIWLYFSLRARHLFFFSNTNPVIENGGVLGESKWTIYQHLPQEYLPRMFLLPAEHRDLHYILNKCRQHDFSFPIFIKPNMGERGFWAEKINDQDELQHYLDQVPAMPLLVQEYVHLPLELSVMYHRFPDAPTGQITSLCIKELLQVTGDGRQTLKELILAYPRARFQWPELANRWANELRLILPAGETKVLMSMGNHCRGAMFLNGHHAIDAALVKVFNRIHEASGPLHYGRFDLRCTSLDLLKQGREFKLLEYNGVAAEPAHIYQPGYALLRAYRDIYHHWSIIYRLHLQMLKKGYQPCNFSQIRADWRRYRTQMRLAKKHSL